MPQNGEINQQFGVYKSLCCDYEIVVPEQVAFPDCPNHVRLTTQWKHVVDEKIRHVRDPVQSKMPTVQSRDFS